MEFRNFVLEKIIRYIKDYKNFNWKKEGGVYKTFVYDNTIEIYRYEDYFGFDYKYGIVVRNGKGNFFRVEGKNSELEKIYKDLEELMENGKLMENGEGNSRNSIYL